LWAITHKIAIKHLNDEFLDKAKKTSPTIMSLFYRSGTPQLWEIAHKTAIKIVNDKFFDMALKPTPTVKGPVNRSGY
jgi:hypothetical protein